MCTPSLSDVYQSTCGDGPDLLHFVSSLAQFMDGRLSIKKAGYMRTCFFIVMGVSGCGNSSVSKVLAEELGWDFYDADDFHPPANVAKIASGIPLDDSDRSPWLNSLNELISSTTCGLTCRRVNSMRWKNRQTHLQLIYQCLCRTLCRKY